MKLMVVVVLALCACFALAEDAKPSKDGPVTIQGCVTRQNGDYVLIRQDPAVSYELQATRKIKLHTYLGQRVEITGQESPSLSTSTDSMSRPASPVTISVSSIKTLEKECGAR